MWQYQQWVIQVACVAVSAVGDTGSTCHSGTCGSISSGLARVAVLAGCNTGSTRGSISNG